MAYTFKPLVVFYYIFFKSGVLNL